MYEVKIHFIDARPGARGEEDGLQRYGYVAPGGGQATVCVNPKAVAAIVPAPAEPERGSGLPTPEEPIGGARPTGIRWTEAGQQPETGGGRPSSLEWRESSVPHLHWNMIARNEELEREILSFLTRFGAATVAQLMREGPIAKHFLEGGALCSLAEEWAYNYLDAMEMEGLVTSSARSGKGSAIKPTDEGLDRAGLGSLPQPPMDPVYEWNYQLKMVDLYLGIMDSLREEAAWVTGSELRSEKARAAREEELGRKLPSPQPGLRQFWPFVPEAVLVLKDTGIMTAVGLDTTWVSERRTAAYEAIFEAFSGDSSLDRACFFFVREGVRPRVEKLAHRYRDDGFFRAQGIPGQEPDGSSRRARQDAKDRLTLAGSGHAGFRVHAVGLF